MRSLWFSGWVGLVCLVWVMPAPAQDPGLYEGEVEVASQSDADRSAAYPEALAQVLRKVGGAAAGQVPVPAGEAADLAQQYRYRQDMVEVDGEWRARLQVIVRFDQDGVQRLLASQGAAAWAANRPEPILWLAIDDGSGLRMVSQAAAAAIEPLSRRAVQRGLRVRVPAWDARDQALVMARDLPSGESYSVDQATQRYGGPALLGWLRRDGEGWVADWRLRDGQVEVARWQNQDLHAAEVLIAGADGMADALSQRHAAQVFTGPAGQYRLRIEGLASAADYAWIMQTLQGQTIVREVDPVELQGGTMELELELSAGIEGLARLLRGSRLGATTVGDLDTPSVFVLSDR